MAADLYDKLHAQVTGIMNKLDGSHDMTHVERVIKNAEYILQEEQAANPHQTFDSGLVRLGALMHDVGDKKYASPGQDVSKLVHDLILSTVDDHEKWRELAEKVQAISSGVSYTAEMKDPKAVEELIAKIPELAIVQDADRLDSIGAAGIARAFTYGGAHRRSMETSRELMDTRLVKLKDYMKTKTGRRMAEERTERLRIFRDWWDEEAEVDEL